ncbi:MAG: oxidoreductase domain protein [Herbinix sp.]|jgi:predicted dehydrogenase|nr:oxidoreductase domain protein [Herbinix sp.]
MEKEDQKQFGWCFIGTGMIAKHVNMFLERSINHRIISVFSRSLNNAVAFAESTGATASSTIKEAITAKEVEGVYIATPTSTHYAIAKECILQGKHVLIEKPFTETKAEAEELFALAKANNVYLCEAMWTWFSPVAREVKRWVETGAIGSVEKAVFKHGRHPKHPPKSENELRNRSALMELGVYSIAYAYNLFGMPISMTCNAKMKDGFDESDIITMQFTNNVVVEAEITDAAILDEQLTIFGTNGHIKNPVFHYSAEAILIKNNESTETTQGNPWYDNEFDLVAAEIRQGKTISDFVPPESTLNVMSLLDQCLEQIGK